LIRLLFLALAWGAGTPAQVDADLQAMLLGKAVVREAQRYLGQPYVWGGKHLAQDGGLDCSGFTSTVFGSFGIELPVSAMDQYRGGLGIEKPALEAGDLVFFLSSSAQTPMHVGIYVGRGRFIHAPGTGKRISLESMSRSYFAARYVGARRYAPPKNLPSTGEAKP
jgi:cell wall-associated NlpC family hydrolase